MLTKSSRYNQIVSLLTEIDDTNLDENSSSQSILFEKSDKNCPRLLCSQTLVQIHQWKLILLLQVLTLRRKISSLYPRKGKNPF